ncbi:class I SAM-dependent RNA methyltransferase [Gulosibacter macacae]|uniref:Class I SAM-dependent RNA methyltransferase n=1 Tax=Gulosibacter macacae TaxID=2488791 RepID=A0A3P3VZD4_9MICO|nr:TRAM domain-containing protein [Gulosibacter macacae]RRJ86799.1 class I SAM-dependent RNA methyltransferase [Gulosibacter macacae]
MTQPAASSDLALGDTVELEVGDVAHGGVFVARHPSGRVVFVADALPGERVRARVTELKKRFARAEAVEVLEASPERLEHVWAEASIDRDPDDRVGGAELGHTSPAFGRELKRRVLTDALNRFGGIDSEVEVAALPGDDDNRGRHWRTRVTLHIDADGQVGPYAARSHHIIPVESLPLAFNDIEELALGVIREGSRGPGRLDFVAPADFEVRMRRRLDGRRARDPEVLRERVAKREFLVREDGFWQVHRHAATTLYAATQRAIDRALIDDNALHLDLYGGVGLLGAALAEVVGDHARVVSVESAAAATEFARENLAEWRDSGAVTARVDRYLRGLLDSDAVTRDAVHAGTVVLDPPRSGAGAEVVDALGELAPAQLVYVACDPVALARDTGMLRERGYELRGIEAFDLFPNTHHVEAVAAFVRA